MAFVCFGFGFCLHREAEQEKQVEAALTRRPEATVFQAEHRDHFQLGRSPAGMRGPLATSAASTHCLSGAEAQQS